MRLHGSVLALHCLLGWLAVVPPHARSKLACRAAIVRTFRCCSHCGVPQHSHEIESWMQVLGEASLDVLYNDGNRGTGTADDLHIEERQALANVCPRDLCLRPRACSLHACDVD